MTPMAKDQHDAMDTAILENLQKNVRKYLASIGAKGGSAKSDAKTAAARENASKPRSKGPRCPCGIMTLKRAKARLHQCSKK